LFGLYQTILGLRLYSVISVSISGIIYAGATGVCTLDILFDAISAVLVSFKVFISVILNNSSISSSVLISVAFYLVLFVLYVQ